MTESSEGGSAQASVSRAISPSLSARSAIDRASPSLKTICTDVCSVRASATSGASASTAPGR